MVEQIPAATANESLGDAILPQAFEVGSLRLVRKAHVRTDDFYAKSGPATKDQITRCRVVREDLTQLLQDPRARRMLSRIATEDPPPVVSNDEEAIQNAKGESRHSEKTRN